MLDVHLSGKSVDLVGIKTCQTMKKTITIIAFAALAIGFMGCTDKAAEQEKLKAEIAPIEANSAALDSTMGEVQKTSQELSELLNQLQAQ
jgi:arsenate reductase-like glutaredoxin family protein